MKTWIKISSWLLFLVAVIVGLSAASRTQNELKSNYPEILIHVDGENAFLTPTEVVKRLEAKNFIYAGQKVDKIPINKIENYLASMSETRSCKVFKNLGETWQIEIELRKPIARIFNNSGESFYLDNLGFPMATSPLYTARVLVVSGDIDDRAHSIPVGEIINNDTLKTIRNLDDIYRISNYVCNDPFLNAQVGQVHRESNGDFVLVPQVGEQIIIFGSAISDEEVATKFEKLKLFYKEGIPFEGWNKYSVINLKFKKQVVCKKIKE